MPNEMICIFLITLFVAITTAEWMVKQMKHGKKPNRTERNLIKANRLNPENWFVCKNTPTELVLVNRLQEHNTRTIRKGVE